MQSLDHFTAVSRFGLGPSPHDPEWLSADPVSWLMAQIQPGLPTPRLQGYRSSGAILSNVFAVQRMSAEERGAFNQRIVREDLRPELLDRFGTHVLTETPFAERLVRFWSNHFTVSNTSRIIAPAIPAYEREVIRPHVFGRFADMLKAVSTHPCMLVYLDNASSIGPNSQLGQRRTQRQGLETTLNENLAREILELHTLGVNGGYDQDDVIEFAKAITGWGHSGQRGRNQNLPDEVLFEFRENAHEPGTKTVLGRRFGEGQREGMRVLDMLARHPSTARHIATKLARHFIADDPPQDAIDTLARVFNETDGDLAEVSRALVLLDQPWSDPLTKIKTHEEYVISVHRLMGGQSLDRQREIVEPLREMNQQVFNAQSPAGWSDRGSDWIGPEALMLRIDWAHRFATTLPGTLSPDDVLEAALGPVCSEDTRTWVSRAESGTDALAMILVSPEFQRR